MNSIQHYAVSLHTRSHDNIMKLRSGRILRNVAPIVQTISPRSIIDQPIMQGATIDPLFKEKLISSVAQYEDSYQSFENQTLYKAYLLRTKIDGKEPMSLETLLKEKAAEEAQNGYADQFERNRLPSREDGFNPQNAEKNRYPDILPYDYNRTCHNSFYINASDITLDGAKYIMTKGPLGSTLEDFWKAVIEKDSSLIVALEYKPPKCTNYWRVSEKVLANGTRITTGKTIMHSEGKIQERTITITDPDGKSRTLTHFLFTAWPDYGVAKAEELHELIQLVNTAQGKSEKPITVHCSAGVGRAGTFVMSRSFENRPPKSLEEYTERCTELRLQRFPAIQSPEQYKFLLEQVEKTL